jgi:hypothetical protein
LAQTGLVHQQLFHNINHPGLKITKIKTTDLFFLHFSIEKLLEESLS